ncbi:MAG: 4-hydroxy-tetrahydrodipicolinate synthase [Nanoarchaeota archaeon]|nr:4-hydroxy-tetrahydrodipicolinate synthase [Nanoarchaeota archaeon]MBU1854652.1 4-hydroxy-tetrahydrodipicolinate synthase [Nanoarchaeota archaeon]
MFKGLFTAIITPFKEDETIDEEALRKLIDFNIKNGVSGIVPCGTTGESPTLSAEEHLRVIEITVQQVAGRVPVIAGTGSNCTKKTIETTQKAEALGINGALVVNPYYNKPTQEGLYQHFKAVANSVKIPIVVYNIKGRTGVNVETSTLMRLVNDCKNIVAVKEASGNMEQMKEVIAQRPKGFSVLSGDDGLTLELIKNGGNGVVSVASNLLPKKMSELTSEALNGNFDKAEKLNKKLEKFFNAEFIETNPIPIKYMVSLKGRCKEVYRLPMCSLTAVSKQKINELMSEMNLI